MHRRLSPCGPAQKRSPAVEISIGIPLLAQDPTSALLGTGVISGCHQRAGQLVELTLGRCQTDPVAGEPDSSSLLGTPEPGFTGIVGGAADSFGDVDQQVTGQPNLGQKVFSGSVVEANQGWWTPVGHLRSSI
jgi:hypothetical protein